MKFIVIPLLCLIHNVFGASPRVDPLVRIKQGLVRGQKASDGDYSTFLGIPYAQVDLDNPFGPARSHPGFGDDIFNAYDDSTRCPQTAILRSATKTERNNEITLDCLRLNVYVPFVASSKSPLPVLVWIHGGSFDSGFAGEYHPRELVKQGIVVVTINYRLGPYGFMCLDVPSVPGNQGLKDQYEALRWIRTNIAAFGGNPYNVTISGQDSGSCSSLLHLYSSKDKLFNKVIAESGTPQNEGMFVEADVDAAVKLAEYLGHNTTDTEQALEFLAKTHHSLVTAAASSLSLTLRPCKERSLSGVSNFVSSDPFSLTNEKIIKNTPILIGHTSNEHMNLLSDKYFKTDPFYEKIRKNFNLEDEQLLEAASIVRHFYLGDKPVATDFTSALEEFESDFVFNHPMQRTVTNLLKENASPVYEYVFSYVRNPEDTGTGHSTELEYLFDIPFESAVQSEGKQLVIERITTLWANFVKYGNPTPEVTELLPVTWAPVGKDTRPYLVIDTDLKLEDRVYKERMSFWDLFYSIYGKKHILARDC